MSEDLKKVIETSYLILHEGDFICAKVKKAPKVKRHFFVAYDDDEITVITNKENAGELDIIEKNEAEYSLLEVKFSVYLNVVGFFAASSSALAEKGISILAVSTYSKDYILVQKKDTEKAAKALIDLGLKRG